MSKLYYCANCGQRLSVVRKSLPKYGTIIELIEAHECLDEPIEFDLTPIKPTLRIKDKSKTKFVQNLNQLNPKPVVTHLDIESDATNLDRDRGGRVELKDRRSKESIKTSAPSSLLDQIKSIENSIPVGNINSEPDGMEGD